MRFLSSSVQFSHSPSQASFSSSSQELEKGGREYWVGIRRGKISTDGRLKERMGTTEKTLELLEDACGKPPTQNKTF